MECEYSQQIVTPGNFARKRQAAFEVDLSGMEVKKRACVDRSFPATGVSWQSENACNLESENTLNNNTQPTHQTNPAANQPSATANYTTFNTLMDVRHSVIHISTDPDQGMDVTCDTAYGTSQLEISHLNCMVMTTSLAGDQSTLSMCPRCLAGESGHINHLSRCS